MTNIAAVLQRITLIRYKHIYIYICIVGSSIMLCDVLPQQPRFRVWNRSRRRKMQEFRVQYEAYQVSCIQSPVFHSLTEI